MKGLIRVFASLIIILVLVQTKVIIGQTNLIQVAKSDQLWTGVAVLKGERIFVCYPRWFQNLKTSVAEILKDGNRVPYPDINWNTWDQNLSGENRFVCVQSVYVDEENHLWILDTGKYGRTLIEKGPKLIQIDPNTDSILQVIYFPQDIVLEKSYLNDVRIDCKSKTAYLTDSGLGAIIVVDLKNKTSRRLLSNHKSTKSEGITITIGGVEWKQPNGSTPEIHSDGLAISPDKKYLYYQALSSRTMYRIKTEYLLDKSLNEDNLSGKVEVVGKFGPVDGIEFDRNGNLYLSSIEENSVKVLSPQNQLKILCKSPQLKWPDSFSIYKNEIFVTCSQLHLLGTTNDPFTLFKIPLQMH